jgi:hypothetical protein
VSDRLHIFSFLINSPINRTVLGRADPAGNVTPHIIPSSVEELVEQVVPLLRRKDICRTEYAGATFRENLGLA